MASFLTAVQNRKSANKSTSCTIEGVKFKLAGHLAAASRTAAADLAENQHDIKLTLPAMVSPEGDQYTPRDIIDDGAELRTLLGLEEKQTVRKAANKGQ